MATQTSLGHIRRTRPTSEAISVRSLAIDARLRAEAMALRDARGDRITQGEWQTITDRLMQAYRALHAAIGSSPVHAGGNQR